MEESRNVEDLHQLRLMALLHELVRERDLRGAAEALGLDPRTLSASMERGQLSGLVQLALERRLLADGDAAVSRCREEVRELRERVDGLEERVAVVEREEGDGQSGSEGGVDLAELAGRVEEQGRVVQQLERRLSRAEAGRGGSAAQGGGGAPAPGRVAGAAPGRRYSGLVTEDPAADDEQVFGAAWPLDRGMARAVAGPRQPAAVLESPLAHHRSPHPRVGGGYAGAARADPAAGDRAAAGPGPGRAVELAPKGPARHPPGAVPPEAVAPGAAAPHPGPVVAVAGSGGRAVSRVAPLLLHSCSLFAPSEQSILSVSAETAQIPLPAPWRGPDTGWRCQAFFQRFPP